MDTHISEIADWLMGCINAPIVIRKEEQGDVDQVIMTLQKVTFIPGGPERDDYVEEDRLVLHGDGRIATDGKGGTADLPRHSYEIPLSSAFRGSLSEEGLQLNTERASYKVITQ